MSKKLTRQASNAESVGSSYQDALLVSPHQRYGVQARRHQLRNKSYSAHLVIHVYCNTYKVFA